METDRAGRPARGAEAAPFVVLVADDEDLFRQAVAEHLRDAGFDVVEAADGPGVVAAAGLHPVDAVVLDVMMPGYDGFRAMEILAGRDDPPGIIVVTALADVDDRLHGLYGGAFSYLTKPLDLDVVEAHVRDAARRHREARRRRLALERDPLTGLGNRRAFEERARHEALRASRYRHPLALVLLRLEGRDGVVRDGGLVAWDERLRAFARSIEAARRDSDHAARIEADVFAVLLAETDREGAGRFVSRLCRLAGVGTDPLYDVGLVWAIAVLPLEAHDAPDLFRAAEKGLWRRAGESQAARRPSSAPVEA